MFKFNEYIEAFHPLWDMPSDKELNRRQIKSTVQYMDAGIGRVENSISDLKAKGFDVTDIEATIILLMSQWKLLKGIVESKNV